MTPFEHPDETSFALGADYGYRFSERWGWAEAFDLVFGEHKRNALVEASGIYYFSIPFKMSFGLGFEVVEAEKGQGRQYDHREQGVPGCHPWSCV